MKKIPADGVTGVTTTAIYCRPGCPSRRPRPEHIVRFPSPADARREGYRACRRCRPDEPARAPGGLLAACAYLAAHAAEPLTLRRLADEAGWSPSHFQRTFRRSLGVSPKEYARRLRFERLGRELRSGGGVASAVYAAGFGSSSRVYERARAQLGMSPATLSRKGAGMSIAYDLVPCPLGRALIAATPLGLCAPPTPISVSEPPLLSEIVAPLSFRRTA